MSMNDDEDDDDDGGDDDDNDNDDDDRDDGAGRSKYNDNFSECNFHLSVKRELLSNGRHQEKTRNSTKWFVWRYWR